MPEPPSPDKHNLAEATSSNIDVSFFVPCYNEEANVTGAIEKLVKASKLSGISYEILVFDDCSRDRTVDYVKAYQNSHPDLPIRFFINEINRGVSRNFVEGAFMGKGQYYRLVCSDVIGPLETHLGILRHMGQADIIIPYFTEIRGRKAYRHFISRLYTA